MTSNRLFTALLAAMVLGSVGYAADTPKPERAEAPARKASATPTGGGDLTPKYCCSNKNGKACQVYGNASCSNCDAFCKGPVDTQPR
jgi:hypothetical protein